MNSVTHSVLIIIFHCVFYFRVNHLHKLFLAPPTSPLRPVFIYLHCYLGADRTGEMLGSYAMRHLNYSWKKANQWNQKIAERPMSKLIQTTESRNE